MRNETILDRILETKHKEVEALRASTSEAILREAIAAAPAPRDWYGAITQQPVRAVNLIAEIKRASPSKGLIRDDFDPPALARAYTRAGVQAISVLTDETYFQGSLDMLRAVRAVTAVPLLRKDFIIDEWQVLEARAAGADAILLIAAALPTDRLRTLHRLAGEVGLSVLLEVHNETELDAVHAARLDEVNPGTRWVLGVNNRDLRTFEVDLHTTIRLRASLGADVTVVGESGIATREDVAQLAAADVRAILVGETFMRQGDVETAIETLLGSMPQ